MSSIHARLDAAFEKHPDRPSLCDFRADLDSVRAEDEALSAAQSVISPHTEIAEMFGQRGVQLDWRRPQDQPSTRVNPSRRIAFPGPVAARKGAFEVREIARELDAEVAVLGAELEGEDFWAGVRVCRPGRTSWLKGVAAVVQPSLVEDRPRMLLAALAAGVPVVATTACGLPPQAGLTLIPTDSVEPLFSALSRLLPR
jgi:glycosyltransferase involved in cell wall biosynthesis